MHITDWLEPNLRKAWLEIHGDIFSDEKDVRKDDDDDTETMNNPQLQKLDTE